MRKGKIAMACMALAGLIFMVGCTPGDLATGRQLTVEAGAAFVFENHARRQEMRRQYYQLVDEVVAKCQDVARAAQVEGNIQEALARVNWCLNFMDRHYPRLATIELLGEGFDAIDDLQKRLDDPAAPGGAAPVIVGGGGSASGTAN